MNQESLYISKFIVALVIMSTYTQPTLLPLFFTDVFTLISCVLLPSDSNTCAITIQINSRLISMKRTGLQYVVLEYLLSLYLCNRAHFAAPVGVARFTQSALCMLSFMVYLNNLVFVTAANCHCSFGKPSNRVIVYFALTVLAVDLQATSTTVRHLVLFS